MLTACLLAPNTDAAECFLPMLVSEPDPVVPPHVLGRTFAATSPAGSPAATATAAETPGAGSTAAVYAATATSGDTNPAADASPAAAAAGSASYARQSRDAGGAAGAGGAAAVLRTTAGEASGTGKAAAVSARAGWNAGAAASAAAAAGPAVPTCSADGERCPRDGGRRHDAARRAAARHGAEWAPYGWGRPSTTAARRAAAAAAAADVDEWCAAADADAARDARPQGEHVQHGPSATTRATGRGRSDDTSAAGRLLGGVRVFIGVEVLLHPRIAAVLPDSERSGWLGLTEAISS